MPLLRAGESRARLLTLVNFRYLTFACRLPRHRHHLRRRCSDAVRHSPTEPISKKKELLFSDDFGRAELGKDKGWAIVVPTYSLEDGALKGTQVRFDTPAKDANPSVKGHQAVAGNDIPTRDSVIGFLLKLCGELV